MLELNSTTSFRQKDVHLVVQGILLALLSGIKKTFI